eukprot:s2788_g11.t1
MCYLQLLATSHSLFVAFEADVGCLDDDAVKRQKSNLEHFHSVIFTIGPCQGLMCNLPRGSMQYLGVGLELRAIGGVSRHVLQPRHTLALCRWHITCASMRQRNPASSMPGVFMSYVLRRPFPLGLESLCESCALHAARPRLGGSAQSLGQKSAIEMGYIDSDSAQRPVGLTRAAAVKSMLRGLCIVLALSGAITGLADTSGVPSVPSCAKIGVAYSEDRDTARSLPNGAYLADAKMCQQSCEVMLDCTHFTWKEDSFPGGACYLFKQLGKEEPDAKAISGPKACVSSEDSKVAQDMPTLPPVAVITPTVKPVAIERTDATGGDDHETLGAAPAATGGGSNMMTNALAGGAVAAIGIGGVAYYFVAGGKKSKSKKKSKRGVGVERAAEAMIRR